MTDLPDPLHFTPVPLHRRARGWTADAQHAFIAALARCGVVAQAARSVGCTPRSAYHLRARSGAESFAAAWDWALEMGLDESRDRAMAMIHGSWQRPLVRHGQVVGHVEQPDLRVMLAALRALGAERNGPRAAMPHRQRIAARAQVERTRDPALARTVDWGAVDLPWFDRSSIDQGPAAVDAACRAARAIEAGAVPRPAPPPPPPKKRRKRRSNRPKRKPRAGPRIVTIGPE